MSLLNCDRNNKAAALKAAAAGRWPEILASLGGIAPESLDGRHHPCPKCGGRDRFRMIDKAAGALYCNKCFPRGNGDGIAALRWLRGWGFREAVDELERYFGLQNGEAGGSKKADQGTPRKLVFATPRGAIRYLMTGLTREHGPGVTFVRAWDYDRFRVLRFNLPTPPGEKQRKSFRPVHRAPIGTEGRGWALGYPQPDEGRPLYRLRELEAAPIDEILTVHGGEKAADAAHDLGLLATSNAGGEGAVAKTDWQPATRFGTVAVVLDRDEKGEEFGRRVGVTLKRLNHSIVVKLIRLPGLPARGDIVEAVAAGLTRECFLEFVEATPAVSDEEIAEWARAGKPAAGGPLIDARELDPATEACNFLRASELDGVSTVRYWHGEFFEWSRGAYRKISASDIHAKVVERLNLRFRKLNSRIVNDVMGQLKAQAILPSSIEPPAWLGDPPTFAGTGKPWPNGSIFVAKNGLVCLPALTKGEEHFLPATPRYFSVNAAEFNFDVDAPAPSEWLGFLLQLWPDDPESISLLQEWCGYLLVPDTSQQKILGVVGPTRSGKGTIGRVMQGLIGEANTAGPTLSGLAAHFGLEDLLGKSLAIISDARLSGRIDQAVVVERLLSISGEDTLTVGRKYLPSVHTRLKTRIAVLTNELPRLTDTSGALAGRMLLLRLRKSFYGQEDPALTSRLLQELPGILLWAVEGWRKLEARGRFVQPQSARDVIDDLRDLSSPVSAFLRERCILEPGRRSSVDELFGAWRAWCEVHNRRESGTAQSFARDLLAAAPAIQKVRPKSGGERYRAYEGIGLLQW